MLDLDYALAHMAEKKILEAMDNGEFDNLPGKGKPLQMEDFSLVPEHLRLGFVLLRTTGYLPLELEISKEIAGLERSLATCRSEAERDKLRQQLSDKRLTFSILIENMRRKRRSSKSE